MWISAVSATFLEIFPAVSLWLGSCFVDFSGFSYFFMYFSGSFAGLGEMFLGFQRFQLLFWRFFRQFRWGWGAVLWISAVSATFFQNISSFWAGLGSCFRSFMDYSYPRPAGNQPKSSSIVKSTGKVRASFPKNKCENCPYKDQCKPKTSNKTSTVYISKESHERAKAQRFTGTWQFKFP